MNNTMTFPFESEYYNGLSLRAIGEHTKYPLIDPIIWRGIHTPKKKLSHGANLTSDKKNSAVDKFIYLQQININPWGSI
jgi:hypothetical protein